MNKDQLIADLKVMIEADKKHLATAIERGDRVHAHQFVDSIIENSRALQDLINA